MTTPSNEPRPKFIDSLLNTIRFVFKWFVRFVISLVVVFVCLFLLEMWTGENAGIPSFSTTLQWYGITFAGIIIAASAVMIVKYLYSFFFSRDRKRDFVPNFADLLLLIHSFVAAFWTGTTSAQGMKAIIAPKAEWQSFDGMISMLAGLMAGILVLGFWTGLFGILDKDADRLFPRSRKMNLKPIKFQDVLSSDTDSGLAQKYVLQSIRVFFLGKFIDFVFFMVFLICVVGPISTVTTVIGMAGERAVFSHIMKGLDNLEEDIRRVARFRSKEIQLISKLESVTDEFEKRQKQAETGTFTQAPGKGLISRTFEDQATNFGTQANRLAASNMDFRGENTQILADISILREKTRKDFNAIDLNNTIHDIQDKIREDLVGIRSRIRDAKNTSLINVIKDELTINLNNFSLDEKPRDDGNFNKTLPPYMRSRLSLNQSIAKKQFDYLIRELPILVESPMQAMQLTEEMLKDANFELDAFNTVEMPIAIFLYWKDIIPAWAIAIAVDAGLLLWALWIWRNGRLRILTHPIYRVKAVKPEEKANAT